MGLKEMFCHPHMFPGPEGLKNDDLISQIQSLKDVKGTSNELQSTLAI